MAEIYETLEKPERLMLVGVAVDNEEEILNERVGGIGSTNKNRGE